MVDMMMVMMVMMMQVLVVEVVVCVPHGRQTHGSLTLAKKAKKSALKTVAEATDGLHLVLFTVKLGVLLNGILVGFRVLFRIQRTARF